MNKLFLALFIVLVSPWMLWAQVEKSIPSTIDKVIVYTQGAQIESEVEFQVQKGQMKIKLPGLSSVLNEESIRIISDGSFTILNVQYQIDYLNVLDKDAESAKIIAKIKDFNFKIEDEETWLKIIREKIDFLTANKQVSGKNEAISPENFKLMNQIYSTNYETLALDALKRQRLVKSYREEVEKLNAQLQNITYQTGTPSGTITVLIDGKQAKTAKMRFTYFTWGASWTPTYDIRFMGFNKPLEITYFANIQQSTQIDWKNVELVLSTAKTQVSAQIPFLQPYYLTFFQPQVLYDKAKGAAPPRALSESEGVTITAYAVEFTPNDSYAPKTTANSQNETVKEYIVKNKQTILSSNSSTAVSYGEGTIEATYDYQSIPKLSEHVYLIAKVNDWMKADLNNGTAKLYLENSYVGKSFINTAQFKDTIDLSFGVDNNITVKREKVKDFSEKTFTGSSRKETIGYKITVRNNKSYGVTTTIYDQIPISVLQEIQVDVLDLNGGTLDKETGKVEWKLELKPNETKTILIKYSVKYPKEKQVVVQ